MYISVPNSSFLYHTIYLPKKIFISNSYLIFYNMQYTLHILFWLLNFRYCMIIVRSYRKSFYCSQLEVTEFRLVEWAKWRLKSQKWSQKAKIMTQKGHIRSQWSCPNHIHASINSEIRSLITTSNINLFAANIYVKAPMNLQRACGGQGNGSSRGLIQSIVHSLCDVYRLATFKHRAGTGICRL